MRARDNCHGSLFWMFADCWGEVGWTVVDGHLRRKPAWYFVRRAYAPIRLIARPDDDGKIRIVIANDTSEDVDLGLDVGYVSLDGKHRDLHRVSAQSPALSRTVATTFERGSHAPQKGIWMARAVDRPDIPVAIFRACDYRELEAPTCKLSSAVIATSEDGCVLRVSTDVFAHAVHVMVPDGALPEDDYFDLMPGEAREIRIRGDVAATMPSVVAVNGGVL
jgi:beta-mannosidase